VNLIALSVPYNHLKALPAEIGQLVHLKTLSLQGNPLTELPKEIGQLQNLKILGPYEIYVLEDEDKVF